MKGLEKHLNRIGKALWDQSGSIGSGKAALMVGAGLSKNAEKREENAEDFPDWAELRTKLINVLAPPCHGCDCLQPAWPHSVENKKCAGRAASRRGFFEMSAGPGGMMRLGQLFEAEFRRADLESTLRAAIPDSKHRPGDVHRDLVRLPWSDIFTTNWDTLLERAVDSYDRSYSPVHTVRQIPRSRGPRIVKLHGTLESGTRLTFTEEDFRSYPSRSAAFVTMVQSSLMENVFCLMGFSGEDPNFLQWHGWIRDQLGDAIPPIYLITFKEPHESERRLLEARRVIPLALEPLLDHTPNGDDKTRYREALRIFLKQLQGMRDENRLNLRWPVLRNRDSIHGVDFDDSMRSGEFCEKFEDHWRRRLQFDPRWVVLPEENIKHLWSSADDDVAILLKKIVQDVGTDEYKPELRLMAAKIVVDLNDRALTVLTLDAALVLTSILIDAIGARNNPAEPVAAPTHGSGSSVHCPMATAIGKIFSKDQPDAEIWSKIKAIGDHAQRSFGAIALSLLRHCRYFEMWGTFDRLHKFLAAGGVVGHDVLTHEICLAHVQRLNVSHALKELQDWSPSSSEPAWLLRKAGLLEELGDIKAAEQLISEVIEATRELRSRGTAGARHLPSMWELSREGWAHWKHRQLLYMYERELRPILENKGIKTPISGLVDELNDRLAELSAWRCDPTDLLSQIERWMLDEVLERRRPPPSPDSAAQEKPALESAVSEEPLPQSTTPEKPSRSPGFAFLRLTELAGIAPRSAKHEQSRLQYRSQPLAITAASLLPEEASGLAFSLLVRTAYRMDEIDNPTVVATHLLDGGSKADLLGRVESAITLCRGMLGANMPPSGSRAGDEVASYTKYRTAFLFEVLAQLVKIAIAKSADGAAQLVLNFACEAHDLSTIEARTNIWPWLRKLFREVFLVLGAQSLAGSLKRLSGLRFPQIPNDPRADARWPDPFQILLELIEEVPAGFYTPLRHEVQRLPAETQDLLVTKSKTFETLGMLLADGDPKVVAVLTRRTNLLRRLLPGGEETIDA